MDKKRKRTDLGITHKCEICAYKDRNPKASQDEIANHFNWEWKTDISRRTVGDILGQTNKWFVGQSDVCGPRTEPKRMRSARNEEMEKALFLWFTQMRGKHAVITDTLLTEKAPYFGRQMAVEWSRTLPIHQDGCCGSKHVTTFPWKRFVVKARA